MAKESGLAQDFLSGDYEDAADQLHRMYLSTQVGQQGIIAQDQVLKKIADQGSCVIVGRAAGHVLRCYPSVVRVFLYAPQDFRVANIQEMYGDNPESARQHMARSDESRAAYYRNVTGSEWRDIGNYDLCLDASIGREEAADLIIAYIQKAEK